MNNVSQQSGLVGLVLATTLAADVGTAQEIRRLGTNFVERLGERTARVSGDIVMGVMLSGAEGARHTIDVAVPVLPPASGDGRHACVRIVSKDGRYEAENTYEIGAGHAGAGGEFSYDGVYAEKISDLANVVLVTSGRCGNRTRLAAPASWADVDAEASELKVYINAAGNPTSVALGRGDTFFEPCENVTEVSGLKYTTICTIPMSLLPKADTAKLSFFITRSFTEEAFSIDVLVPGSG